MKYGLDFEGFTVQSLADSVNLAMCRIYSLMGGSMGSASASASSSAKPVSEREEVTPEVVQGNGDNGNDPWRK